MLFYKPDRAIEVEQINKPNNPPEIHIDIETLARIKEIVRLSPKEVSWFSRVTRSDNVFCITDAFLIEQTVSSAETEMTLSGLSDFMTNIIQEHGVEFYNSIRCWGHSHVEMSPNPSGQDLKQIKEFDNGDFYIMLIMNKRDDFHIRLYDFKENCIWKNLPLYIETPNIQTDKIQAELDKKVKSQYSTYRGGSYAYETYIPPAKGGATANLLDGYFDDVRVDTGINPLYAKPEDLATAFNSTFGKTKKYNQECLNDDALFAASKKAFKGVKSEAEFEDIIDSMINLYISLEDELPVYSIVDCIGDSRLAKQATKYYRCVLQDTAEFNAILDKVNSDEALKQTLLQNFDIDTMLILYEDEDETGDIYDSVIEDLYQEYLDYSTAYITKNQQKKKGNQNGQIKTNTDSKSKPNK